ncbi:MAG: Ig-like domain-containing protein [Candidatus Sulfotelmatobacter sp.]
MQWISSATGIATVSSGGLAVGVGQGSVTISASSGTISGSAALSVAPPVLTGISISPGSASIAKGTTQQFAATGTYSDGSTQNLTGTVTWSSSPTAVATIATSGLATGAGVGSATITATSGSITASATLSVGQPVLVSMAVTPANPSFALGTTQPLAATGTYSDGSTLDLTNSATWSTADGSIATVNTQGVVTGVAPGNTGVAATSGSITGSTTLTVTPAVLVSIAVTPAIPTIPLGTTQPFTATGTYTDGSMQNITGTVQWSSDTPTVATISNATGSQGVASGVGQGTANIRASVGSVASSTTLSVTSAALVSLAITPATPSLALGTTQQFTATGTFTDGSTQNLTSTATWSSDTISTATINNTGLASSVGIGTATITAISGSVNSSTALTVTAAALVSITINPPAPPTIPLGMTQQFTATGTFTDGTTQDLTPSGHWSSTVATVATISDSAGTAGLATTLATGTTTIGISSGSVSTSVPLMVNPAALVSIAINPQSPTIALGTAQQFTATGTYTDGSTQDLTTVVTWSSSSAMVAIISNAVGSYGVATSSGQGTAIISATSNSISSSTSITVSGPALVSIAITPASPSIPLGTSLQFDAMGTYTDGSTQDLTSLATWTSSSPAVAPVTAGLVMGSLLGSANITASSGTVNGSTSVMVTAPVLISLSVTPANSTIANGTSQQFTATGTYSDGTTQNLSSSVTWSSSSMTVATIASSGLATGTGVGTATLTATSGSITASATLNVGPAILVSLTVTPANSSFALGTTLPLVATGTYSDGSTLVLTTSATWTTADSTIATVNSQGVASSVALGSTTVTATSGTISGSTTLTISPAVLVSIAVTPAIPTIPLGTSEQFTATGTYTDGSTQNITSTVQWGSDTATVATISNAAPTQGLGSSVGEGTATITATSGSVSGSTTLTVSTAALVSLAVTPATPSIALGTSEQFTATGTFTDGGTQDLTSTATWSSDTVSTATTNAAGLAKSVGVGTATVTATVGEFSNSTVLTVTPATVVSIVIYPLATTIPLGTTQQFTATGTFTDGSTQDLTRSGQWSSTVAAVATVSMTAGTAGLASTLTTGTTTIGISSGGVSATATLVVNPAALASITINPQAPTIALGTTQQFTATGTYTDGSTQDLTTVVTWSSSSATVAIIGNAVGSYGLATSSGQGTATITATAGTISNSTAITVGQASMSSIAVTPSSIVVSLGYGEQFSATATFSDSSTQDITQSALWTSSVPSVATINSSGYATSISTGTTTVSATFGSMSAGATLMVNPAIAISLVVTPASSSVIVGGQQQISATLNYSNGSSVNVTSTVTWSSSKPAVATVSSDGLATGVADGSSTIEATWGSNSLTATATVTVSAPMVSGAIPGWPTFGIDLISVSPFPGVNGAAGPSGTGGVRLLGIPKAMRPYIETANNVFNFASVDSILATAFVGSVYYAQAALALTPYFATSTADYTDATHCNYYVSGGNLTTQAPGQCDPPSDLNSNGTGANLYWRNWVAAFAAHVNAAGYSTTHAHVNVWEIWNEPDSGGFWSTKYGTYDQLIRMEQDAYCIIKGGSFTVSATGESCATVRGTVTSVTISGPIDPTAKIAMPSYHAQSPELQMGQNFLYCNASPGSSCHTGGGAAQTDVVNFHMKPGNNEPTVMESVMSTWTDNIASILQSAELAKPLYNTEGGYSETGWTCPASPAGFCYTDANMQASYIARFYIYSYSLGVSNNVWYDWSSTNEGLGSTNADTAYTEVYNWLVGSTFGSCSVSGTVWTCTMTLANGVAAAAVWDTSQSCTPCTTMDQTVGSTYLSYLGLLTGGTKTTIVGNTVPVGIQPILVQAQ